MLRKQSQQDVGSDVVRKVADDFLAQYPSILAKDGITLGQRPKATWAALCQALFASADFLYRP